MKILVLGSDGFFGRNVVTALSSDHEVIGGTRRANAVGLDQHYIDLTKRETVAAALKSLTPEVIINCAGSVENNEKAAVNPLMTRTLLEEVVASGLKPKAIVISGSASEYGIVDNLPVKETAPLRATSPYAQSKVAEVATGLEFRDKHNLPVLIARIFNPIGVGMGPRFLISNVLAQIDEIKAGTRQKLEVSSLSSRRDCCHILDAAEAVKVLIENSPKEAVYNIASGKSTSNGEIIDLLIEYSKLAERPQVIETATEPEPLVAVQADISRIKDEFGWEPKRTIPETIQEIVNAGK